MSISNVSVFCGVQPICSGGPACTYHRKVKKKRQEYNINQLLRPLAFLFVSSLDIYLLMGYRQVQSGTPESRLYRTSPSGSGMMSNCHSFSSIHAILLLNVVTCLCGMKCQSFRISCFCRKSNDRRESVWICMRLLHLFIMMCNK